MNDLQRKPQLSTREEGEERTQSAPAQTAAHSRPVWYVASVLGLGIVVSVSSWWTDFRKADIDPRCTIQAPAELSTEIARSINRSKLWRAYFDAIQPSAEGAQPMVAFSLSMERETTKGRGGEYDPGSVIATFSVTNLTNGAIVCRKDAEIELAPFILGVFDRDSSRDEMQEAAFKDAESRVVPYLDRWIELSAVSAMGEQGLDGERFRPTLRTLIDSGWTHGDERSAARKALYKIGGAS